MRVFLDSNLQGMLKNIGLKEGEACAACQSRLNSWDALRDVDVNEAPTPKAEKDVVLRKTA